MKGQKSFLFQIRSFKIWGLIRRLQVIHECRCDERLKDKAQESTRLVYTGFHGGLQHGWVCDLEAIGAPSIFKVIRKKLQSLERPSGSSEHHRGLHKHHIRGCGPLLLLLSLISYPKLASWHLLRFPRFYLSFRIYSRRVSRQGAPGPFHYPPPHLKRPRLRST